MATGRNVVTTLHLPPTGTGDSLLPASPSPSPSTRATRLAQQRERERERERVRPGTYVVIGALALVVLLGVFQYWVTNVEESRSQSELLRRLKIDLASTADGGVPAPPVAGHPIGLLEIPALGLEKVVVEGDSARRLEQGPGHDPASARPGEAGDVLVVGRRTSYGAPFAHIGRLHDGDTVSITTARGRFTYRVGLQTPRATAHDGNGSLTLATGAAGIASDRVVSITAQLQGKPLVLGKARAVQPVDLGRIGGWVSDAGAWLWILLWGGLLVTALAVAARAYRRTSTRVTYLLTTPVIVALLFCTLGALDLLLPVTR